MKIVLRSEVAFTWRCLKLSLAKDRASIKLYIILMSCKICSTNKIVQPMPREMTIKSQLCRRSSESRKRLKNNNIMKRNWRFWTPSLTEEMTKNGKLQGRSSYKVRKPCNLSQSTLKNKRCKPLSKQGITLWLPKSIIYKLRQKLSSWVGLKRRSLGIPRIRAWINWSHCKVLSDP